MGYINIKISGSQFTYIYQHLVELNLLLYSKKAISVFCSASNKYLLLGKTITLNENELEGVSDTTFLGIFIDRNKRWNKCVEKVCNMMSSGIFVFKIIAHICNVKSSRSVYIEFIHPHILNGLFLFSSTLVATFNIILVLQKTDIQIILGLSR